MIRDAVVIGSGPAGIACAHALVERGIRPLVLDGGARLEPERIGETAFDVDPDELPLKPSFGSLYPYATEAGFRFAGAGGMASHAVGGLSTVWGAGLLPHAREETDGWPDLTEHYRAVLRFVPLAGEEDELAERFPLHVDSPPQLRPTQQVAALLADLRTADVLAGRSRLAVHTARCDYLGLCLVGCPTGAIWSSAQTLERLVADGKAEHLAGAIATRFEERGSAVTLHLRSGESIETRRAFVAAGTYATAKLVLGSTGRDELAIRDSAYFTFPVLRRRSGGRVAPPLAGNTLAQAFVEIDDRAVSSRLVHLSVYGFNELVLRAVAARAHLRPPVALRVLQPLLSRLFYVQGFLHSDESPGMRAALEGDELVVEAERGDTLSRARSVAAKVRSLGAGLEPLSRMVRAWPPGKGFHAGSSLPMGSETDALGRLPGFERVHVVDASVLPSLPATTITLPVMANAHRIGAEV